MIKLKTKAECRAARKEQRAKLKVELETSIGNMMQELGIYQYVDDVDDVSIEDIERLKTKRRPNVVAFDILLKSTTVEFIEKQKRTD